MNCTIINVPKLGDFCIDNIYFSMLHQDKSLANQIINLCFNQWFYKKCKSESTFWDGKGSFLFKYSRLKLDLLFFTIFNFTVQLSLG